MRWISTAPQACGSKAAFVWRIVHRADDWAQETGWEPAPGDA